MASTLRVPTEFTAVDKFTNVVAKMTSGVRNFSKTAQASLSRVNNRLDRMIGLTDAVRGALTGLTIGALFAAAISDLKAYDDALASFRVIVSDLSNKEFTQFESAIGDVAKQTRKSTIDVANSFERIAGLNADFAKTAQGISEVSKQAIILSKASGSDETENLVGIMNQFNLEAKEAARVSNVLAAGQAAGAASIAQSAEAYKNFGSVAKGANITLEQSQALIQTLGKFSLFGAEAGTKLRGVTLQLQKAGLGYKSGQFQINDALADAQRKMNKLTTAKQKDAYLTKLFGAENITAGKILIANTETYNKFTDAVTGTNQAQEQAALKGNTLNTKIQELRASFTNLLTTNDQAKTGLNLTKDVLGLLANNMDVVIGAVTALTVGYLGLKVIQATVATLTFLNSVAMGAFGAATGKASIAIGGNTVALAAYKVTSMIVLGLTKAWTAAQWLLNVALTANPIGIIIVAIGALIAIIVLIVSKVEGWGEAWKHTFEGAKLVFKAYVAFVKLYFNTLVNGIMIGLNYIMLGWYKFKQAMGLGDENQNMQAIKRIQQDTEARKKAITDGIKEVADLSARAVNEFSAAGQSLKWKSEAEVTPVQRLDSPQENTAKLIQESRIRGNIGINLNDPGNNIKNFDTSGFKEIPITVTKTQGAF